jgi:hypothetical protein
MKTINRKKLKLFLFIVWLAFSANGQITSRSTFSMAGLSKTITAENNTYYVNQTIGQKSVIGTYKNKNYEIRQGFQQPITLAKIANQNNLELSALVYPNPVEEKVNIRIAENLKTKLTITVYNVLGKLLYTNKKDYLQKFSLDMKFLSSGNYFLKLSANGKNQTYKLIKK